METENFKDNLRFTDQEKGAMEELLRGEKGIGKFRCDNCKWNYIHSCHDPRSSNVTWQMECEEFEPKVIHPPSVHIYPKKPWWWKRLFRWFGFCQPRVRRRRDSLSH